MKKTILISSILLGSSLLSIGQNSIAPETGKTYVSTLQYGFLNQGTTIFNVRDSASPVKNAAFYLAKSKQQNTTAWVFASAGAVLIGAAIIVSNGKEKTNTGSWDFGPSNKEVWTAVLGGLGSGFLIASIPSFITAGVNKHKARVAFSNEKTGYGIPGGGGIINGIAVTIPIGR